MVKRGQTSSSSAFYCTNCEESKSNPNIRGRGPRCFECNSYGHISVNCHQRLNIWQNSKSTNSGSSTDSAAKCARGLCVFSPFGPINDSGTTKLVNNQGVLVNNSVRDKASAKKRTFDVVYVDDVFTFETDVEECDASDSVGDRDVNLSSLNLVGDVSDLNVTSSLNLVEDESDDDSSDFMNGSVSSIVDLFESKAVSSPY